jgi:hypothetical protein
MHLPWQGLVRTCESRPRRLTRLRRKKIVKHDLDWDMLEPHVGPLRPYSGSRVVRTSERPAPSYCITELERDMLEPRVDPAEAPLIAADGRTFKRLNYHITDLDQDMLEPRVHPAELHSL